MLTVQVLDVPEHAPPQPIKIEPTAGLAVSVILWPEAKVVEHVLPQLIAAGLLVTMPLPVPDLLTVRRDVPAGAVKEAVSDAPEYSA